MVRLLLLGWLLFQGGYSFAQDNQSVFETDPITEPRHEAGTNAEGENADQQSASPLNEVAIFERLGRLEATIETVRSDQKGDGQIDREVRDLQAQEDMAFWAKAMFWATAGTVVLTLLALLALIRTLHHTRRAADYAKDMVDEAKNTTTAAVESLRLTEKHGRAQLRAYLTLKECSVPDSIPDGFLGVRFLVENSGQTPANIRRICTVARAVTGKIMKHDISNGTDRAYRATIGAGHAMTMHGGNTLVRMDKFHDKIKSGDMSIVAHISIEYADIFDEVHTSTFTRVMEGGMNIPGSLAVSPDYPDEAT